MAVIKISPEDMQKLVYEALEGPFDHQKLMYAGEVLTQVCIQNPDEFWPNFWLAGVKSKIGDVISATAILYRCLQMKDARIFDVWNNLGTIWRRVNVTEKSREAYDNAYSIDDNDPDVINNLGTLYVNEGSPEEGEAIMRKGLEINPGHPHLNWNLSLLLLEQQRWGEGFDRYVWGMCTKDRPNKPYVDSRGRTVPWWHGQSVVTLVVYGEQGVGDEIMFASMVPDLALFCDRLILDMHPRLVNLFKRSFAHLPNVTVYGNRKDYDTVPDWAGSMEIDAKCALGNCARFLRFNESMFEPFKGGYLRPNPDLRFEAMRLINHTGPVVGVSWIGGTTSTRKDLRSIPLKALEPILEAIPNAAIVSLQYTDEHEEIEAYNATHDRKIKSFPDWTVASYQRSYTVARDGQKVADFSDKEEAKAFIGSYLHGNGAITENRGPAFDLDRKAAMMAACDIIVTVNQTNVWMGGALGLPTMVLSPKKAAWRYGLTRTDTAWFSSIHQFRNDGESWEQAIRELANSIEGYLK
jgi:hypothetical protein